MKLPEGAKYNTIPCGTPIGGKKNCTDAHLCDSCVRQVKMLGSIADLKWLCDKLLPFAQELSMIDRPHTILTDGGPCDCAWCRLWDRAQEWRP